MSKHLLRITAVTKVATGLNVMSSDALFRAPRHLVHTGVMNLWRVRVSRGPTRRGDVDA